MFNLSGCKQYKDNVMHVDFSLIDSFYLTFRLMVTSARVYARYQPVFDGPSIQSYNFRSRFGCKLNYLVFVLRFLQIYDVCRFR